MVCPVCGTSLPDGAAFCANFGSPLAAPSFPQPPAMGGLYPDPASFPLPGQAPFPGPTPEKSKKPLVIGIIVGAIALAAVVLAVFLLVIPGLSTGSEESPDVKAQVNVHESAEAVCDELTRGANDLIADGVGPDALEDGLDLLVELVPEEAAVYVSKVGSSHESLIEGLDRATVQMMGYSNVFALLEYVDVEVSFEVGAELGHSELTRINNYFFRIGAGGVEATAGYRLDVELSVTALEDTGSYEKGESYSETPDDTGIYAIEVNGSWYVWGMF